MTTTNSNSNASTSTNITEIRARRRGAMSALSVAMGARNGGRSTSSADSIVANLTTGTHTKANGKVVKINLTWTARLIVRLVKLGQAERVPAEARARFPWGAVSRDVLLDVATSFGVDGAAFLRALGIGAAPVPVPATHTEPPDISADEEAYEQALSNSTSEGDMASPEPTPTPEPAPTSEATPRRRGRGARA